MTAGHYRRSIRLAGYDYGSPGAYFVTICTHERRMLLEDEKGSEIVKTMWQEIPRHFPIADVDEFVVMPNHVHGIVLLLNQDARAVVAQHAAPLRLAKLMPGSLGVIVRSFKSSVTNGLHHEGLASGAVWQRNYYERVVRSDAELNRIRSYIMDNPAK